MNISKSNHTKSGCGCYTYLLCGFSTTSNYCKYNIQFPLLIFQWNEGKITVKVEETKLQKW